MSLPTANLPATENTEILVTKKVVKTVTISRNKYYITQYVKKKKS